MTSRPKEAEKSPGLANVGLDLVLIACIVANGVGAGSGWVSVYGAVFPAMLLGYRLGVTR